MNNTKKEKYEVKEGNYPIILSVENDKYVMNIVQDENPFDPREKYHIGTMICKHDRYSLGDKPGEYNEMSIDDVTELATAEGIVWFPLYLYDHSGITMRTTPFSCPWDSGQVGYIFISKEQMEEEKITPEKAEEYLRYEVEEYDNYLQGNYWGIVLEEKKICLTCNHTEYEVVESLWGFFGKLKDAPILDIKSNFPEDSHELLQALINY